MGITENYQYNFLLSQIIYKKINLTKTIVKKSYNYLQSEYLKDRVSFTKNNVNRIIMILNTLKRLKFKKYKSFLLDYIMHQYRGDIEIINLNKKIIVAKNLSKIGKTYSLPCDPFKDYGICSIIKNGKFHYIRYSPNYRFFIESDFKINKPDKKQVTDKILQLMKTFPGIIIYYNHKKITGSIRTNSFYVFDKIKYLNIFFGYGIKYSTVKKMSNTINREVLKYLKPLLFKFITLSVIVIIIFYLIFFTIFKKQFKIIDLAIRDYEKRALIDKLTGLYNREGFEEEIKNRNCKYFILLDLDNFKYINDSLGHQAGDRILREFAWLLKKYFKNDILGRWGGDEFLICTDKEKDRIIETFEILNNEIYNIQKKIDKNLKKRLSVSAGICSRTDLNPQKRFINADLALYKIKKKNKGNILFYEDIDYIKMEKTDLDAKNK
jgi:diguanylate cyclase (GGDEF)-like protein